VNNSGTSRRLRFQSASSGALATNVTSATSDNFTPSRYTGLFVASRLSSTQFTDSLDDAVTSTTFTRNSQSLSAAPLVFLGTSDSVGSEFSDAKIGFSFAGFGLSAADIANLRAILADSFLVQVGAVAPTVANLPPAANFKGQSYLVPDLGGGGGLIQSDGTNWSRDGEGGYETQANTSTNKTLVYLTNASNQNFTGALSADINAVLSDTDAKGTAVKKGACIVVTRSDGSTAHTLTVQDGAGATVKQIPNSTAAAVRACFDGTAWKEMGYGPL